MSAANEPAEDCSPVVCGCRVDVSMSSKLKDPAPDCPFCDGTGILIRTVPKEPGK